MFDRRALPGTLAGLVGLAIAVASMATRDAWLLVPATLATVLSVVLVLTGPDHLPLRWRERRQLRDQAQRLAMDNDRMAARAARFEAEAIAARKKLAAALLADHARATATTGSASGPEVDLREGHDLTDGPDDASLRQTAAAGTDPVDAAGSAGGAGSDDPMALVTDPASGVFTQVFFDASLGKRISAARRGLRPLSVALIEVVERVGEPDQRPTAPRPVAEILTDTLREADTVAMVADGLFGVLLEDTPENGAIWTLERVRRRVSEDLPGSTMRAGLSCYPAYAFDAEQILDQAASALDAAREWRQDRIEVTTATPDE